MDGTLQTRLRCEKASAVVFLGGENVPRANTAACLVMRLRTNQVCPKGKAVGAPQQRGRVFETLPL